jgi:lipooligosaccharide transport system permease protein
MMRRALMALVPGSTGRGGTVTYRNMRAAKTFWSTVFSGLFEPFLYLLSIGVGVGALVGQIELDGRLVDYTSFVAPAMLASAAMNAAIAESTFNTFSKLHWDNTYEAMIATPLTPSDIALGELGFAQARGALYSLVFLAAMAVLGLVESWWAVLAFPAAIGVGLAFGSAGLVAVTFMRTWEDMDLVLLFQVGLFLFSATFYPLDVYPQALQYVAWFSPLYHGATLCRNLVLGTVGPADLIHAGVLVVVTVVALRVAGRRYRLLLHA